MNLNPPSKNALVSKTSYKYFAKAKEKNHHKKEEVQASSLDFFFLLVAGGGLGPPTSGL